MDTGSLTSPERSSTQTTIPPTTALQTTGSARTGDIALKGTSTRQGTSNRARSHLVVTLAVALGARLVVWLASALASAYLSAGPRSNPSRTALIHAHSLFAPHSVLALLFGTWGNWDGAWFAGIAAQGYARAGGPAFFPLYPLSMRLAAPLFGGHDVIAGVLLSLLFFALACGLLYRLLAKEFSPQVALWSIVFVSVFPTSFFFGATYSESLFLLASVSCFYLARERRFWLAGLAGAAASLTRNTGLLLLIPMGMYYLDERGWKLRNVDRKALSLAFLPAGMASYMAYLWVRFGDPLFFLTAEARWKRSLALPPVTLYRAIGNVIRIAGRIGTSARLGPNTLHNLLAFAVVLFLLVIIALGWRLLPKPYTAYAACSLLLPLCYPERTMPLMSMARFAVVIFPVFVTLALVTERRPRLRIITVAVFVAGMIALTVVFALRTYFVG